MTHRVLGLLALAGGLLVNMSAGSIVQDGGFEVPNGTNYSGSLGDGWTATQGIIDIFTVADGFGGVPYLGSQAAYLDDSDSINTLSQTLATVIGQSYIVSYWVADTAPNSLMVSFGGQVLFNGTAPSGGVALPNDYVNYQYTVTATSASTVLSFTGQWLQLPNGYGTALDEVSVTAVPEPATVGLTALALALILRRPLKTLARRG